MYSWCELRSDTWLRQNPPPPKARSETNKTIEDYNKENKRLKIEVELMSDFLRHVKSK